MGGGSSHCLVEKGDGLGGAVGARFSSILHGLTLLYSRMGPGEACRLQIMGGLGPTQPTDTKAFLSDTATFTGIPWILPKEALGENFGCFSKN